MSPEAQSIAIAEACGWEVITRSQMSADLREIAEVFEARFAMRRPDNKTHIRALPDYYKNLNAMHEAEAQLEDMGLCDDYVTILYEVATRKAEDWFLVYHATAAQRAEAFLRTIGKWEEGGK